VQHLASRHVLLHSAARLRCAFPADDPRSQASFCRFSCYSTMAESSCSCVALFHGEALPAPQLSRLMGRWVSDASGLWPGRGSLSEEVTLAYERYLPPLAALAAAGGGNRDRRRSSNQDTAFHNRIFDQTRMGNSIQDKMARLGHRFRGSCCCENGPSSPIKSGAGHPLFVVNVVYFLYLT
jgi:hypothetical protein